MSDAAAIVQDRQCAAQHCRCHRPPRRTTNGLTWRVHCPAHPDEHPSLDVTKTPGGKVLLHCQSVRCPQADVIARLRERNLWTAATSYGPAPKVRYFVYMDEHGQPLHRTGRKDLPDGKLIWQEYLVNGCQPPL